MSKRIFPMLLIVAAWVSAGAVTRQAAAQDGRPNMPAHASQKKLCVIYPSDACKNIGIYFQYGFKKYRLPGPYNGNYEKEFNDALLVHSRNFQPGLIFVYPSGNSVHKDNWLRGRRMNAPEGEKSVIQVVGWWFMDGPTPEGRDLQVPHVRAGRPSIEGRPQIFGLFDLQRQSVVNGIFQFASHPDSELDIYIQSHGEDGLAMADMYAYRKSDHLLVNIYFKHNLIPEWKSIIDKFYEIEKEARQN